MRGWVAVAALGERPRVTLVMLAPRIAKMGRGAPNRRWRPTYGEGHVIVQIVAPTMGRA